MHKRMMHPPAAARKGRHAEPAMSRTASVARRRTQEEAGRTGTIGRAASGRTGAGPASRPRGPTNLTTRASPAGRPHI